MLLVTHVEYTETTKLPQQDTVQGNKAKVSVINKVLELYVHHKTNHYYYTKKLKTTALIRCRAPSKITLLNNMKLMLPPDT